MDAFGKEYHLSMLAESISYCSMKFWMLPVVISLKENVYLINWEIIFQLAFKKDTEKVALFCY